MEIVKRVNRMREIAVDLRRSEQRIALVPTMGYLHDGHLSLLRRARRMADQVVMSVYVNPTQFGPREDLATYPRDTHRDIELAGKEGVDHVFLPDDREMYPEGYATWVTVTGLAEKLCGRSRPDHFRGVTTIVAKLLAIVTPRYAFFGEKDAQQLAIVRRMVADLDIDAEVIGCPTVREADGLAMSSRNVRLAPDERAAAPSLHRALKRAQEAFHGGEREGVRLASVIREALAGQPLVEVEYIEVVDPARLEPLETVAERVLCAVAARIGENRLIDNLTLDAGEI